MGRSTGLEPATTRTTIWRSTIELRPPSYKNTTPSKIKESIDYCFSMAYNNKNDKSASSSFKLFQIIHRTAVSLTLKTS